MSEILHAHRRASPGASELPDANRCAWTSDMLAERCHYPGAMSHGTRGDGPWYCAGHFFCSDGADGADIIAISRGYVPGADIVYPARQQRLEEAAQATDDMLVQEEPGANG